MKRRDFIAACGGATVAAHLAKQPILNADSNKSELCVDFHAHPILPSYLEGMRRLGIDPKQAEGFPAPNWSVKNHLKFMQDANIDYTVLSMPSPILAGDDLSLVRQTVRAFNEEVATLCREYPDKFGFVAALPLPDVEGAIAECQYAFTKLGALGVKVASNNAGVYLGNPCLDELWSYLNERNTLVIVHPSPAQLRPSAQDVVTGTVAALFEYPVDTTRAVLNLAVNKTCERYPNLRWIIPHVGSFLPYMKSRASSMFKLFAAMKMAEPVDLQRVFDSMYFDLAGDPTPENLDALLSLAPADRLIYGSDFPYSPTTAILSKKAALDAELHKRGLRDTVYTHTPQALLNLGRDVKTSFND